MKRASKTTSNMVHKHKVKYYQYKRILCPNPTHLDNLRRLQQTEFRGLANALWRNPGARRSGGAQKRPRGLIGGVNHQVHQSGSHGRKKEGTQSIHYFKILLCMHLASLEDT